MAQLLRKLLSRHLRWYPAGMVDAGERSALNRDWLLASKVIFGIGMIAILPGGVIGVLRSSESSSYKLLAVFVGLPVLVLILVVGVAVLMATTRFLWPD